MSEKSQKVRQCWGGKVVDIVKLCLGNGLRRYRWLSRDTGLFDDLSQPWAYELT